MNAVLEAARRIVAWDDSGRLADDEWLVERNETAIIAICRALLSTSAAVRGMREALEMVAALDDCEAHIEDALERIFPKVHSALKQAALSGIEGEDEQARPSGSAPISTDTKGTTK